MRNFEIESKAGVVCGLYDGDTAEEALVSLHRDAGYGSSVVWIDEHGDIEFDSEDTKEMLGDVSDWIITEK